MDIPRVVATDLDGTLLRSGAVLSARTRRALRAARAAGIRVVAATARPARVVTQVFGDTDLLDAVICGNGAVRFDPATREMTLTHPLLPPLATHVMAEVGRLVPQTWFATETGHHVLHEPGYHHRPSLDNDRFAVQTRKELVTAPVVKVMALVPHTDPGDAWSALHPTLDDLVACTWSAGHGMAGLGHSSILEIAAPGVCKSAALADRCAQWMVDPAQVAAFGDAPNDLDMLLWAGAGYAVANAHPEVLAAAPHRVPANDEDGVAQFLERVTAGWR